MREAGGPMGTDFGRRGSKAGRKTNKKIPQPLPMKEEGLES